jgi:hypothetical protein
MKLPNRLDVVTVDPINIFPETVEACIAFEYRVEPERLDAMSVLARKVEKEIEPVIVDAEMVDNKAVLPVSVENTNGVVINVETVTVDPINVLPITVDANRLVTSKVEPVMAERTVIEPDAIVLPIKVENPMNPAFILETDTLESVTVLPFIIENPSVFV